MVLSQTAFIIAMTLVAADDGLPAQQPVGVDWKPGTEVSVEDASAGIDGCFLVYVPTDYDPREKWPVVFYYHGLGGRPDTGTIRKIAMDKYCIVVGMSYYAPGMEGYRFLGTEDVRILNHVLEVLKGHLSVNDKRLYVAGFSKGGFYTCEMLRLRSDILAGAIILAAGSKAIDAQWPNMSGKDVFIACGQQDSLLPMATATEKRLTELGAMVMFEQWPGIGHSIGDIAGLRKWLFEQTIDRPYADAAPSNTDNCAGLRSAKAKSSAKSPPWAMEALILCAMIAVVVYLAMRRKARRSLESSAESSES